MRCPWLSCWSFDRRQLVPASSIGFGLIGILAWAHPFLTQVFQYPLDQTLAGEYLWGPVLLMETALVLAAPGWLAFCLSPELRLSGSFLSWQVAYWVFFVAAMVVGLLPGIVRDR